MRSLGSDPGAASAAVVAAGHAPEPGEVPANAVAPSTGDVADPAVDRAVRTAELDGLRAAAVLIVFTYHALLMAVPLQRYVLPEALALEAGVEVFFVLSGFLIYSPFVRAHLAGDGPPRLVDYLRRRVLRIYPAYWVALAVLLALGWVHVEGAQRLLAEVTLTQGYRRAGFLAGEGLLPAWTLCVEVAFDAFVPLWALLVRRAGRRLGPVGAEVGGALALIAVGVACQAWASYGEIPLPLVVLFPNLPTLGCGMLLAVVATARPRAPRLDRLARLVPPAIVCWPLAFLALFRMPGRPTAWPPTSGEWFVADLTQSLFGILLALPVMVGAAGLVGRALRWAPVTGLGLVSYGIYLWHYDVLNDLWPAAWEGGRLRAAGAIAALFALSVALGAASHYLIERPAQAWARRIERRRRQAPAGPPGGDAPAPEARARGAGGRGGYAAARCSLTCSSTWRRVDFFTNRALHTMSGHSTMPLGGLTSVGSMAPAPAAITWLSSSRMIGM